MAIYVVQMRFPYMELANHAEKFIERKMTPVAPVQPSPKPDAGSGRRGRAGDAINAATEAAAVRRKEAGATARSGERAASVLRVNAWSHCRNRSARGRRRRTTRRSSPTRKENYYTEGERVRGEWQGQLAERWGLTRRGAGAAVRAAVGGPASGDRRAACPSSDGA